MEFDSPRQLEAAFRDMHQSFDGKETEQNWQPREKNIAKLKKITAGTAPQDFTYVYLTGIRSLLDGILKTANSLRTTLSTAGCSLVQDIANASGPGIDNMVDILLQNFIKLCASTKPISRSNGNDTVLAVLANASYHLRIMQHIYGACQDKNLNPRRFACGWLKKIIKKHPRNVVEHAGGLDLIEKCIKVGLQDKDKDVRELMRPTFWAFARRWPERSESIMSTLDKSKQEQLLADESNPNRTKAESSAPTFPAEEKSQFSKSMSAVPSGKSSLKEVKARMAAQKKAEAVASRPNSAQDIARKASEETSTSKPSLKEVKARLAAEKKAESANEKPPSRPESRHKALEEPSVVQTRPTITASESKPGFQKTTASHSEKAGVADYKRTKPRYEFTAPTQSPPPQTTLDDLVTAPILAKPAAQKKSQPVSERPRSADAPTPHLNRQGSATNVKVGNLTSAPMRPRRKPAVKKAENESSNTAPLDLGDALDLGDQQGLKLRPEPLKEDEIPEGDLIAEKASTKVFGKPTKQEMFNVYEAFELLKHSSDVEKVESPLHCLKLLESAQVRIQARSLDIHGFRKLQNLIRDQGSNSTIWQDGYKIEELLMPLLEWLEEPLPSPSEIDMSHALDLRTQILLTVRLILKHHRQFAKFFYTHALSSLLVLREHFSGKEHIVSGIEETMSFIVGNCNAKQCMNTICDMLEHDLGDRAYELALHTLSSLLHRLHRHPSNGGGGLGQQLGHGDENLARRLGRTTTALLEDRDLVIRRAAIEVALEIYYCVPEDDFFKLIAQKNENHRNVILYYLSRHKKVHDEEEEE